MGKIQKKVNTSWNSNIAYGVGLITADGCLNKDGSHILFSSKDFELIEKFKKSLYLNNKIGRYARGGETEKKYFCITFGDINFYNFLNKIGLKVKRCQVLFPTKK